MRLIYLNNPQLNREQQGYIHNINQHVYNKKPLVIYFYKEGCPYCRDAKELLKSKNIPFKEIKVTDSNIEKIYKKIDNKTKKYRYFPIIFKNNIFIGGFSDLNKNNL